MLEKEATNEACRCQGVGRGSWSSSWWGAFPCRAPAPVPSASREWDNAATDSPDRRPRALPSSAASKFMLHSPTSETGYNCDLKWHVGCFCDLILFSVQTESGNEWQIMCSRILLYWWFVMWWNDHQVKTDVILDFHSSSSVSYIYI